MKNITLKDFITYAKNGEIKGRNSLVLNATLPLFVVAVRGAVMEANEDINKNSKGIKGKSKFKPLSFDEFLKYCEEIPQEFVKKYTGIDELKVSLETMKLEEDGRNFLYQQEWEKARQTFMKLLFCLLMFMIAETNRQRQEEQGE